MTQPITRDEIAVIALSIDESPVYLRTFDNGLHLVDASGQKLGIQIAVATFERDDGVRTATVELAHQGYWHEGSVLTERKATAGEIKIGLRAAGKSNIPTFVPSALCGRGENGPDLEVAGPTAKINDRLRRSYEARKSYWLHRLSTGAVTLEQLGDDIAKLRNEIALTRKRGEDTSALLYRWDSAGLPPGDGVQGMLARVETTTAQLRDELKVGPISNRFIPNAVQLQAMRLVAKLINAGAVALVDDQYIQGEQVFRALKIGEGTASVRDPHAKPEVAEAQSVEAVQGEAVSFLDPLEQAIDQSVRLVAESEGELAVKLSRHLDALLAEQLKRVTADE
ncbi:hypothetical protein AB4P95_20125 [Pseudomonas sp. A1437]|uniref:hypothetical protein n=1 Tax=unclassified Pseudomonas TaxID=196821 RepID=UPI0037844D60